MIVHLGYVIDSVAFTVSLTQEKVVKLCDACAAMVENGNPSLRELASLIG